MWCSHNRHVADCIGKSFCYNLLVLRFGQQSVTLVFHFLSKDFVLSLNPQTPQQAVHRPNGKGVAHRAFPIAEPNTEVPSRVTREAQKNASLAPYATRSLGAGKRAKPELPDPIRTCFERDRDRILYHKAFRRLAGKCQVFIAPDNAHLRHRLSHAIEVAQVAKAIAEPIGANTDLVEAAALAHDCGHGPGGHASEDALGVFLSEGFHHASFGADVVLKPLNLCEEVLDAVRNHSWNQPGPSTPEGEIVAWADRIAYVAHDYQDALLAGVVTSSDLPSSIRDSIGGKQSSQLRAFINAMIETVTETGCIMLREPEATILAQFRAFNYEHIYLRPDSKKQAAKVVELLRALAEFYIKNPSQNPLYVEWIESGEPEIEPVNDTLEVLAAVTYIAGMTDRFAFRTAQELLSYPLHKIPQSV